MRRAQGAGGYYASRAAFIGGFDATSNVLAGRDYGIPVSGTIAPSYIESYDDELTAFIHFADVQPDDCVLLVDTYNTLKSGLPNAITTTKRMEENGHRLSGIRLDSAILLNSHLVIFENSGHSLFLEETQKFNTELIKFARQ